MGQFESTKQHGDERARRRTSASPTGTGGANMSLAEKIKNQIERTTGPNRPPFTREQAGAMARLFTNAIRIWKLSDDEAEGVLGGMSLQTLAQWAKDRVEHLDQAHCDRLVRLILVHQGLRYVFDDPNKSYAWIHRPAPLFDGRTALEFVTDADLSDLEWFHGWLTGARIG